MRHLAALGVIYGHCYALASNPEGVVDLIAAILPGYYAGSLAVYLFFAISGFLVTRSLIQRPGVMRYTRNRTLRVYPAYLACILLSVFLLGPALTTLTVDEYFGTPETWYYLRKNLIPSAFAWNLPGVFEQNPLPDTVNGTLWSLGLEVRCYFYLGILAALTLVQRRLAFTTAALLLLGASAWQWHIDDPDPLGYRALMQTFLIAALAAHWLGQHRPRHLVFLALVLPTALLSQTPLFGVAMTITLVYAVLWFAYTLPVSNWPPRLDISYGLFLYGFPVQQTIMSIDPSLSPLGLLAWSLLATIPIAAASWLLIERPALRFKLRPTAADRDPAP
ncbi:MAG: acyltransferase [Lysobacteraceae bacterium]